MTEKTHQPLRLEYEAPRRSFVRVMFDDMASALVAMLVLVGVLIHLSFFAV